jgi:hypothetical protein
VVHHRQALFRRASGEHPPGLGNGDQDVVGDPVIARDGSGRVVVFALGVDGEIYRNGQATPSGSWRGWGNYLNHPPTTTLTGSPVLGLNANGHLSLFIRGSDGALWHLSMNESGFGNSWQSLGGALANLDGIAVSVNADRRLTVIVNNTSGGISYRTQRTPSGSLWTEWTNLTGTTSAPSHPTAVSNFDGRASVFLSADKKLQVRSQPAINDPTWTNWSTLATGVNSPPVAILDSTGILHVFALDASSFLHEMLQTSRNSATWTSWTAGNLGGTLSGL